MLKKIGYELSFIKELRAKTKSSFTVSITFEQEKKMKSVRMTYDKYVVKLDVFEM